jgi:hypothetical protein
VAPLAGGVVATQPPRTTVAVTARASWVYPYVKPGASQVLLALGRIGGGTGGAWSARAWAPRAWYARAWYKPGAAGIQPLALPLTQVKWQEAWRYPVLKVAKALPFGVAVPDSPTARPVVATFAVVDAFRQPFEPSQFATTFYPPDAPPRAPGVVQALSPVPPAALQLRVQILPPPVVAPDSPPGTPGLARVPQVAPAPVQLLRAVFTQGTVVVPDAPPGSLSVLRVSGVPTLTPFVRSLIVPPTPLPDVPPGEPPTLQFSATVAPVVQLPRPTALQAAPSADAPSGTGEVLQIASVVWPMQPLARPLLTTSSDSLPPVLGLLTLQPVPAMAPRLQIARLGLLPTPTPPAVLPKATPGALLRLAYPFQQPCDPGSALLPATGWIALATDPRYVVARISVRSFMASRLARLFVTSRAAARNFTRSAVSNRRFDEKDPTEKVILTFDFSIDLAAGVTLSGSPSVQVDTVFGTDASPSSILNGSAQLDGTATKVLVPVQAGVDGCEYRVSVRCGTTSAQIYLELDAVLPVRS